MERDIGIQGYGTRGPGVGGRIKVAAEDFVVEEVPRPPPEAAEGLHLWVRVTARNWETNRLIRQLARALRISRHRIGFAGTKDKRGVTTQYMTLERVEPDDLPRVRLKDVTVEPLHRTSRPLRLGDLRGNRFRIRLRDLAVPTKEARLRLDAVVDELDALGGFPNFFGPQRFGRQRPISHRVGRALVRGDLEEAVRLYVAEPFPTEDPAVQAARRAFDESRDAAQALQTFPPHLGFERSMLHHLRSRPGDYAGALQQLPRNLLTLLVNAFQSFLFNRVLSLRLQEGPPLGEPAVGDLVVARDKRGLPDRSHPVAVTPANREKVRTQVGEGKAWVTAPLVGYEVPLAEGPMGDLERRVLAEESVDPDRFAVSALPRLASRGLRREVVAPVHDFAVEVDGDAFLTFTLPPGAYATVLLREIRKGDSP